VEIIKLLLPQYSVSLSKLKKLETDPGRDLKARMLYVGLLLLDYEMNIYGLMTSGFPIYGDWN
jgi:hypothetical protein